MIVSNSTVFCSLKNPCDITEATALLSERMQLTGYEAKMAKVVENIIMGEGQDALNFIEVCINLLMVM